MSRVRTILSNAGSELAKAVVNGLVAALGVYLAVLIVSPTELRRWWYDLPDPNDFRGEWSGLVGGRYAELTVESQEETSGAFSFAGWITMELGGSEQKLHVTGKADSAVIIKGKVDEASELVIALQRVSFERGPNEEYLALMPNIGDSTPAKLCPMGGTFMNIENCKPYGEGPTQFFK